MERWLVEWRKLCHDMNKRLEKESKMKSFREKEYWKTKFIPKGQSLHCENIDRMKFPFWCWYLVEPVSKRTFGKACYKKLGMVNKVSDSLYVLFEVEKQTSNSNFVDGSESLLDLVRRRRITVCKGESEVWE